MVLGVGVGGMAMPTIPAFFAASRPGPESSKAMAFAGTTPSLAQLVR
nr:hypothetical protein [Desulfotalea psychrophila]